MVSRDSNAITATDERGTVHVPAASVGVLLLGPGTTVTHQAIVLMSDSGSTVVWVGERGVRYYAHGVSLSRSSRLLESQAAAVSNTKTRLRTLFKSATVRRLGMRDAACRGDRLSSARIVEMIDDNLACSALADDLVREGQLLQWGIPATGVLVETLLDRGADADVAEAEAAIERLAVAPAEEGLAIRDIWLLRLRALLAQARSDATAYADFRDRYRDMAKTLGYEGHIAWAEAMP